MRPLPTVGGDTGTWGTVLNAYLQELVPSGAMMEYAGAAAPSGWLLCDGTSYLRADYNDLFTALGGASSPWGLPDGTHFNVPDMRGRMPVGKGTHADVDNLAENDGAALANRRPKHRHTVNDGLHDHTVAGRSIAAGAGGGAFMGSDHSGDYGLNSAMNSSNITVGPQTSIPGDDAPAYVVVNYIIKT